jgi:hypothetical protein
VILALWVPFPWNPDRGVAIPILFRIYRSKKLSPSAEYRKRTVLALELLRVLETWMADLDREVMLVGDSEYSCCTVIKHLPARFHFTGPAVMDAALFSLLPDPPKKRGRGQPRKKGDRLPTPAKILSDPAYPWIKMKVFIYGRTVDIRIKTLICQWYQVAGPRPVRIVITRDPTGRLDDRVYVSTDSKATVDRRSACSPGAGPWRSPSTTRSNTSDWNIPRMAGGTFPIVAARRRRSPVLNREPAKDRGPSSGQSPACCTCTDSSTFGTSSTATPKRTLRGPGDWHPGT